MLVIGAGPAGLEAARALALRGYRVTLAEASDTLGGRVIRESAMPGLAEWRRVADYRVNALSRHTRVEVFRQSPLSVQDVRDFGAAHVLVATGSTWRADGIGRSYHRPITGIDALPVFTPDDIMAGRVPKGEVVLFDDDSYYMGGLMAEELLRRGCRVHLVTPFAMVGPWSETTFDQRRVQARLMEQGAVLHLSHSIARITSEGAMLGCGYTGREVEISANAVVLVTERNPNDALFQALSAEPLDGVQSLRAIGDCHAPGIIAAAVYSGHLAARELEEPAETTGFRRERIVVQN